MSIITSIIQDDTRAVGATLRSGDLPAGFLYRSQAVPDLLGYIYAASSRQATRGEFELELELGLQASAGTAAFSSHALEHMTKFRRQAGRESTALVAVCLTRQQQAPQASWPATEQLWAYHAMAALRQISRPEHVR